MSGKRSRTEVRFGIGDPEDLRSSSWTVKGGADSSVYVLNRDIGDVVKASLHPRRSEHPGREWRIALVDDRGDLANVHPELIERFDGRVVEAWDSELCRLDNGPLRQGFAVLLGRFSMGRPPLPRDPDALAKYRRKLAKVDWIDETPPVGQAWQFTVLLTDPGVALSGTPGRRAMKALRVGTFVLPNGTHVWVVRHLTPISDQLREIISRTASAMVNRLGVSEDHSVYRADLQGTSDSLRFFVEIAVTLHDPALPA